MGGALCTIQEILDSQPGALVGWGSSPEEAWRRLGGVSDLSGNWFFGLETPVMAKRLRKLSLASFRSRANEKKGFWLRDVNLRSLIIRALSGAQAVASEEDELSSGRRSWRANLDIRSISNFGLKLEELGFVGGEGRREGGEVATKLTPRKKEKHVSISGQLKQRNDGDGEVLEVRGSQIHANGLFARQRIEKGEMVVEYKGDLIRHAVADLREKKASDDQEGGDASCYMFRLDDEYVVDATFRGNCARFINHSCQPNCYCKVVECDERKRHIVIFAKHDIQQDEEITYDYQFAVESEKLLCSCGAPNCLGRLN
jgi:hypothetical protein